MSYSGTGPVSSSPSQQTSSNCVPLAGVAGSSRWNSSRTCDIAQEEGLRGLGHGHEGTFARRATGIQINGSLSQRFTPQKKSFPQPRHMTTGSGEHVSSPGAPRKVFCYFPPAAPPFSSLLGTPEQAGVM